MKKTMLIFTVIILFTLLQNGCSNNLKEKQVSSIKKDSLNKNEPKKREITKTEHFRLSSISGTFSPHGGFYDYDASKKKWCERPMGADIFAYEAQNNIDDPGKVPDLSNYFDEKISNMINTNILSIVTRENNKIISLRFGGNLIFEDSVNLQTMSVKISKPLKNFIGEIPGSMDLSEGRDYTISIKSPSIKYSNEIGEYELNFSKVTTEDISIVLTEKAYFHKESSIETKGKGYVVKGQNVLIEKLSEKFAYVKFVNSKGSITRGWLLKSDLSISIQD
jgi:hypothetical protein